jgi:perosamine synthetase
MIDAAAYSTRVRETFASLKSITRYDVAVAHAIAIPDGRGYLVPVCKLHADDATLIALLAAWRERAQAVFPTQFRVTFEGTRRWLRERVLDVQDRILFLVLDRHGHVVGHLGFAEGFSAGRTIKADNMIRGAEQSEPGIMRAAMATEIVWAQTELGVHRVVAPILRENQRTVRFFQELGFEHARDIPLRRRRLGDHILLSPVEEGDTAPPDTYWLLYQLVGKAPNDAVASAAERAEERSHV